MPQSLAKVYPHVIFSTKNREPVLLDEWRDELFRVMGDTANHLGCQALIVGGTIDHVHLLFQLGRTITIADKLGRSNQRRPLGSTRILHPRRRFIGKRGMRHFP
jgi:REP element-mobilizing transposase RayT